MGADSTGKAVMGPSVLMVWKYEEAGNLEFRGLEGRVFTGWWGFQRTLQRVPRRARV